MTKGGIDTLVCKYIGVDGGHLRGFSYSEHERFYVTEAELHDALLGHQPKDTNAEHYEDEDIPLLATEVALVPSLLEDDEDETPEQTPPTGSDDPAVSNPRRFGPGLGPGEHARIGGFVRFSNDFSGGEEIRTLGSLARSAVFKTAAFDHSATPPCVLRYSIFGCLRMAMGDIFIVGAFEREDERRPDTDTGTANVAADAHDSRADLM